MERIEAVQDSLVLGQIQKLEGTKLQTGLGLKGIWVEFLYTQREQLMSDLGYIGASGVTSFLEDIRRL